MSDVTFSFGGDTTALNHGLGGTGNRIAQSNTTRRKNIRKRTGITISDARAPVVTPFTNIPKISKTSFTVLSTFNVLINFCQYE